MEWNELVPFRGRRRRVANNHDMTTPFEQIHHEIDRLFADFMPQLSSGKDFEGRNGILPAVDLSEKDDVLEIKADIPGLEEKDIDVTLRDGDLIIRGERKYEEEEKKKNYYRAERSYGAFTRSIALPCAVDENHIDASFKNGVLTVRLPKSREARENERKIPIKAA